MVLESADPVFQFKFRDGALVCMCRFIQAKMYQFWALANMANDTDISNHGNSFLFLLSKVENPQFQTNGSLL